MRRGPAMGDPPYPRCRCSVGCHRRRTEPPMHGPFARQPRLGPGLGEGRHPHLRVAGGKGIDDYRGRLLWPARSRQRADTFPWTFLTSPVGPIRPAGAFSWRTRVSSGVETISACAPARWPPGGLGRRQPFGEEQRRTNRAGLHVGGPDCHLNSWARFATDIILVFSAPASSASNHLAQSDQGPTIGRSGVVLTRGGHQCSPGAAPEPEPSSGASKCPPRLDSPEQFAYP